MWQRKELKYTHASDEHGWIEGNPSPALGEKLLLVPGHCDPTINLYDWYVAHWGVDDLCQFSPRGTLFLCGIVCVWGAENPDVESLSRVK